MIYHCVRCGLQCHALAVPASPRRSGLCALLKQPVWVECDCKAEQEELGRVGGFPDVDSPSPAFDAEWARLWGAGP